MVESDFPGAIEEAEAAGHLARESAVVYPEPLFIRHSTKQFYLSCTAAVSARSVLTSATKIGAATTSLTPHEPSPGLSVWKFYSQPRGLLRLPWPFFSVLSPSYIFCTQVEIVGDEPAQDLWQVMRRTLYP